MKMMMMMMMMMMKLQFYSIIIEKKYVYLIPTKISFKYI